MIVVCSIIGALLLVASVFVGIYYYRSRVLQNEMALMLWKISSVELKKLVEMVRAVRMRHVPRTTLCAPHYCAAK